MTVGLAKLCFTIYHPWMLTLGLIVLPLVTTSGSRKASRINAPHVRSYLTKSEAQRQSSLSPQAILFRFCSLGDLSLNISQTYSINLQYMSLTLSSLCLFMSMTKNPINKMIIMEVLECFLVYGPQCVK